LDSFALGGLGFSEIVLIVIIALFLIGPNSITAITPFIKVAYKKWLSLMREVNEVRGEVKEVEDSIVKPIKDAEAEVEAEMRVVEKSVGMAAQEKRKTAEQVTAPVTPQAKKPVAPQLKTAEEDKKTSPALDEKKEKNPASSKKGTSQKNKGEF